MPSIHPAIIAIVATNSAIISSNATRIASHAANIPLWVIIAELLVIAAFAIFCIWIAWYSR